MMSRAKVTQKLCPVMGRGGMLVEPAQTLKMSLVSRRGTLVGGVGVECGERRVGGSNGAVGVGWRCRTG